MEISEAVMDRQERLGFLLRQLYHGRGFSRYRMSKFEEYDLYSRNKEFLLSEGVITFTDTGGKLMALKPDVTLSMVKNLRDCGNGLQKLYYHENVYRVSAGTEGFREETQVGVECMGLVDGKVLSETLKLAAESLEALSRAWVLEVSHLDLLRAMVDTVAVDEKTRRRMLACAGEKNLHGIREICRENGLAEGAEEPLLSLLSTYGPPRTVMPRIRKIAEENGCGDYARELAEALAVFMGSEAGEKIWIDFSATGDLRYYNGIAFKGFLRGIPDPVLSGGQYDGLMRRMGRKDRAIGFAVFLNRLERLEEEADPGRESEERGTAPADGRGQETPGQEGGQAK